MITTKIVRNDKESRLNFITLAKVKIKRSFANFLLLMPINNVTNWTNSQNIAAKI
jgi:hypothetical protein